MIKKIIATWKNQRNEYFSVGNDDIAKGNLVMLFQASMVTAIMTVCLILITPCIIVGWKPIIQHLLLVPVSACMGLGALWYKRQAGKSTTVINTLCYSFIAVILIFIIALDALQSRDKPSSFMPVMLVAIPVLFTLRFRYLYTELFVLEVIYIVIEYKYKTVSMAQCDLFNSIVGMIFSVIVASIIQRLRAESYLLQNQYKKLSMTDGLTGIMNKSNCEFAIHEYLEKRIPEENCALMILDVDNFKMVNDTLGHKAGDEILGSVGEILSYSFRGTDILGRFGGDEFLVVMCHLPGTDIVSKKCELVALKMKELSLMYPCTITCSIGIAYVSGAETCYEKIFQIADGALYEAKASGKSCYVMHEVNESNIAGGNKPLMLIADNSEINREILKLTLQDSYEIIEADSGKEALKQIGRYQEALAVVLLNLVMPDGDGYQVLRYVKQRRNIENIPVVVISSESRNEKEVLQMGAADMLVKPFDAENVQIRVKNALKKCKESDR